MSEIVNLRLARKRKARAEARAVGDDNRLRHGRADTEITRTDAEREKAARELDGKRRSSDET